MKRTEERESRVRRVRDLKRRIVNRDVDRALGERRVHDMDLARRCALRLHAPPRQSTLISLLRKAQHAP